MPTPLLRKLFFAIGFLALLRPAFPADSTSPTLYITGDSTVKNHGNIIQGWGDAIGEFFDTGKIKIENDAVPGRSSRTFLTEGLWEKVHAKLQKGDFVLMQFGHNDTRAPISAARYSLSGIGEETEDATDAKTGQKIVLHTYGWYLRKFISDTTAAGATPIVLSPVPRNRWSGGKIVRGEENHGEWATQVAAAMHVSFIDINAIIADRYDPVGQPRIKRLFFPQDNTHTNPAGAKVNAACVVLGILQLPDSPLRGYLRDNAAELAAAAAIIPDAAATEPATQPTAGALLFPADGAENVCPDTPLRITFSSPPELDNAGKITIFEAGIKEPVETIDLKSPTATQTIGGLPHFNYYPVIVLGNAATIYPHNHALDYDKSYTVVVDPGVFKAAESPSKWHFTTKGFAPATGTTRLTIAADGTGDFCTVQGGLDFIPDANRTPTTLFVRNGIYNELIYFTDKHELTIQGEDRKKTIIAYANNNAFNHANDLHTYHRGVFLAKNVYDLTLENLTIRNTTPRGGSQAEALIFQNTISSQAKLINVDLYSFQDTLQINGQAYLSNCYIEGDVDFMWGSGPCFFENCECKITRSKGYFTQIRNPATNHGYVYYHCTLDGSEGIAGAYISRIDPKAFPASEVVLIDCVLDKSVGDVAWLLNNRKGTAEADASKVHFWEFNSHGADGAAVDIGKRLAISRQLKQSEDAELIKNYSDPTWVLGNDWNPRSTALH